MVETIRVILAEPAALVRSLLRAALAADGVAIVGETTSKRELTELVRSERPDVVVANSCLADGDLEPVLACLADEGARVLVVARDASPERLIGFLANGVGGYLLHDSAPTSVADAVRSVAGGDVALHPVAASLVVEQWRRLRSEGGRARNERLELTPRETEVLTAMVDGLSNKAIARELGMAVKTVENHKTRVFDKLGVRTQAHAVALAISQGLLATIDPAPSPVGGT